MKAWQAASYSRQSRRISSSRRGSDLGPSPAEPDQAAQLVAGFAAARRIGGRGIQDLELHHGIGHPHGDPRQAGQGLLQQHALELELLNLTRGRTAAAEKQLPGLFPPFGRLLPIAGDPQIPAVLAQRPLQHFHARMETIERLLPCGRIDPLHVDDVIDAQLVFGGFAGRGQHDAERVVARQEPGEKRAAGPADLFRDRRFVVAVQERSSARSSADRFPFRRGCVVTWLFS